MKFSTLATVAVAALASVAAAAPYRRTERYYGQKVFQCTYNDEASAATMYNAVNEIGFDLWKAKSHGNTHTYDIRVTREQSRMYSHMFRDCAVIVPDVEHYVAKIEQETFKPKSDKAPEGYFEEYHTYDEVKEFYQGLAAQFPDLAEFIPSIGSTLEGRDIFAFRFTGNNGTTDKPSIFYQCQIHAREWISGAVCGYVIDHLLNSYGGNNTETKVLDSVVFNVIPIINPDGFSYTWTNDRLWRKNRNPNNGNACRGVDINRNYNSHWGQGGSSSSACSDTYMGTAANSELEAQATISFFQSTAPHLLGLDWHSYSQLVLRPYGWTRNDSPDEPLLKEIGDGIRDAIESVHGTQFTSQKSIDLYVTTGTTSDWFYDEEATALNRGYRAAGFTIELRDTGRYGFQLPAEQIIPSGEEQVPAVLFMVQRILASPILAKN